MAGAGDQKDAVLRFHDHVRQRVDEGPGETRPHDELGALAMTNRDRLSSTHDKSGRVSPYPSISLALPMAKNCEWAPLAARLLREDRQASKEVLVGHVRETVRWRRVAINPCLSGNVFGDHRCGFSLARSALGVDDFDVGGGSGAVGDVGQIERILGQPGARWPRESAASLRLTASNATRTSERAWRRRPSYWARASAERLSRQRTARSAGPPS